MHTAPLTKFLLVIWLCVAAVSSRVGSAAPLSFYVPVDSPQAESAVSALAAHVQANGLHEVNIKAVNYWPRYQQDLRNGEQGIYLAAPHFAAWVIHHHNFVPLARLAEPLRYVVASRRRDSHIFEVNDLNRRNVCARRPLNLDYLLLSQAFAKSMHAANMLLVDSSSAEMQSGDSACEAFVVADHDYRRLDQQQPDEFIRLYQSSSYNNYAIVAHPQSDSEVLTRVFDVLQGTAAQPMLERIFANYATRPDLIPASRDDYPLSYAESLAIYW